MRVTPKTAHSAKLPSDTPGVLSLQNLLLVYKTQRCRPTPIPCPQQLALKHRSHSPGQATKLRPLPSLPPEDEATQEIPQETALFSVSRPLAGQARCPYLSSVEMSTDSMSSVSRRQTRHRSASPKHLEGPPPLLEVEVGRRGDKGCSEELRCVHGSQFCLAQHHHTAVLKSTGAVLPRAPPTSYRLKARPTVRWQT